MKRTKKEILFSVATLLIVIGLVITIPITYALSNNNNDEKIEIISERDQFTKHFKNGDGSMTAVSYPTPVHYQDEDGKWQNIDNSIVETNFRSRNIENHFVLKDNPYLDLKISKNTQEQEIVSMNVENHPLKIGIENIGLKSSSTFAQEVPQKAKYQLEEQKNNVIYNDVFENVDLILHTSSLSVTSEMKWKEKNEFSQFTYNIKTDLKALKTEHNLVLLQDDNNKNIYAIQSPYLYDSGINKTQSFDTTVSLEKTTEGYKLTYQFDEEWLNSEERVYPVTMSSNGIQVTNDRNRVNVLDTYVHPNDSTSHNHVNEDRLFVGKRDGISKAFINWANLPSINGTITGGFLSFNFFPGTSTWGSLDLQRVNSPWNSSNLTWNQQLSLSTIWLYSWLEPHDWKGYKNFDLNVTDTVKGWYNQGGLSYGRNGFKITYTDESLNDYNAIISSDSSYASEAWPCLYINYNPYVAPKTASTVGCDYGFGDINTKPLAEYVNGRLSNMGYQTYQNLSPNRYNLKNQTINNQYFLQSDIVYLAGHGSTNTTNWKNCGNEPVGLRAGVEDVPTNPYYVGVGQYNLSNVKFVMIESCESAAYENNITKYFVSSGAKSALGWTTVIQTISAKSWLTRFWDTINNGGTISEANDYANADWYLMPDIKNSRIYGNNSIRLNPLSYRSNIKLNNEYNFSKVTTKNNIDKDIHELIKENINPNFNEKDYTLQISESNGKTIYDLGLTINNIKINMGYTIFIVEDQIIKIFDNTKNLNVNDVKNKVSKISVSELKNDEDKILYYDAVTEKFDVISIEK